MASRLLSSSRKPPRLVDISVSLQNDIQSDPPGYTPTIEYVDHKQSAKDVVKFFPGLKESDLPDGEGWALENISLTTHAGTHLDAPYHYSAKMNKNERAITIDEVPLEWCFNRGVKLDFSKKPNGHVVTAEEVEEELERIDHKLEPFDIVVVHTSAGARYGYDDYVQSGCGMGREATLYLLERGVKVTGTDAWSWDSPFYYTAQRFAETKDPSIIWEGHKAGRDMEYCHIEKLSNLDKLPSTGFTISCFPVKIKAASAGWTRAVAILDE